MATEGQFWRTRDHIFNSLRFNHVNGCVWLVSGLLHLQLWHLEKSSLPRPSDSALRHQRLVIWCSVIQLSFGLKRCRCRGLLELTAEPFYVQSGEDLCCMLFIFRAHQSCWRNIFKAFEIATSGRHRTLIVSPLSLMPPVLTNEPEPRHDCHIQSLYSNC